MTSGSLNGCRYGLGARKATGIPDSGGREPEVLIKVVFGECGRERKPRTLSMVVPEDRIMKLLESARSKGRARQRVRRKGRGCVERRKARRREGRRKVEKGLSAAAEEFSPRRAYPPLPKEPEPGLTMYQAVAKKVREGIVGTVKGGAQGDGENDSEDEEEFFDARPEDGGGGEESEEGTDADAEADAEADVESVANDKTDVEAEDDADAEVEAEDKSSHE